MTIAELFLQIRRKRIKSQVTARKDADISYSSAQPYERSPGEIDKLKKNETLPNENKDGLLHVPHIGAKIALTEQHDKQQ